MKVLMLTWEFPPSTAGGMAAHVDGLTMAMSQFGHDVIVLTRRVSGTDRDANVAGVRVVRTDIDLPWIDSSAIAATASSNHHLVTAVARLDGWTPDVVHAHDWNVAWAADTIAEITGAPLVTTFHGTARSRHGGNLSTPVATEINNVEWWQAYRSRRVITTTKLIRRDVLEGFECGPDHALHIPPGIDPTWWRTGSPGDDMSGRDRTVLAWGRVQYEKGFQVLARAVGRLRGRVEGVDCIIAGRGSYLPELQSQIDLAQAGELIDLPGYVDDHALRNAVHAAGCVVIPSLYEPFGVVVLEALAGGAPLIVADTGGLADLVADTGAALTFEPGNSDALADCIERLLTDPDLARSLVRAGDRLLSEQYSWDAIAERTLAVYRDL